MDKGSELSSSTGSDKEESKRHANIVNCPNVITKERVENLEGEFLIKDPSGPYSYVVHWPPPEQLLALLIVKQAETLAVDFGHEIISYRNSLFHS